MKKTKTSPPPKRPYNQTARAEAAEATAARIVDVFYGFLTSDWYDSISLDSVAKAAGVTVPTILRRFGSKEGLLEAAKEKMEREVEARRAVKPGDVVAAVDSIVNDYEAAADIMLRIMAQEDRLAVLKELTDYGRMQHRDWVEASFAPQLAGLKPAEREWRLDGLVTALDIYVWKVLRIDRARSPPEVARYMRNLVKGILDGQ
ncbi:TetR/AcrR family transcriptional regulator [Hyphomonas sp.]|uniref:TetR/AcrR family transcriptional regulator n=1 Tax=Hyphomonas sp. TaxID=87 RepID=UPI001D2D517E|nr:TetR/AcrR family transcriptional regulator [Hyphomonas sp.]MBU4061844.1 TetR/AcrR family transcriptional regulator [Alphaproteobacteria bacterium]MBU4163324.1 TetR/AcrR family transcriptional regulator [Alphaproteobacteria bacterium]